MLRKSDAAKLRVTPRAYHDAFKAVRTVFFTQGADKTLQFRAVVPEEHVHFPVALPVMDTGRVQLLRMNIPAAE